MKRIVYFVEVMWSELCVKLSCNMNYQEYFEKSVSKNQNKKSCTQKTVINATT